MTDNNILTKSSTHTDISSDLNSMNSPKHSISIDSSLLTSSPSILEGPACIVDNKDQDQDQDPATEEELSQLLPNTPENHQQVKTHDKSKSKANKTNTCNKSASTASSSIKREKSISKENNTENESNSISIQTLQPMSIYRDEIIASSCHTSFTNNNKNSKVSTTCIENQPLLNQQISQQISQKSFSSSIVHSNNKITQNKPSKKRRHLEKSKSNHHPIFRDKYIPKYNSDHLSIHKSLDPIIIQTDPIKYKIHGLVDHFDETMPNDLIGKLSPDEFKITIKMINKFLKTSLKRQYRLLILGTFLCGCTAGLSFIPAYKSNYDILNNLKKILDGENERIYQKMLNMKWGLIIRPVNQRFLEYNLIVEFVPRFNFTMPD